MCSYNFFPNFLFSYNFGKSRGFSLWRCQIYFLGVSQIYKMWPEKHMEKVRNPKQRNKKSKTSIEEIIDLKERSWEWISEYVLLEGNELSTGEKRNMTLWQQGSGFHVLWKSCCNRTRVQWIQIFRDIKYYVFRKERKWKAFDYFWVYEWH